MAGDLAGSTKVPRLERLTYDGSTVPAMDHGRSCSGFHPFDRREFLGIAAAAIMAVLSGCSGGRRRNAPTGTASTLPAGQPIPAAPLPPANAALGAIPPPHPGSATVISRPPSGVKSLALTIDDGFCASCVTAYVEFAETSGTPITFSPNGTYRQVWEPRAEQLRTLIAAGQVQIGNHTWSHKRLIGRGDGDIEADLGRNEEWIQEVFGITARPWFRPPYGLRNAHTDAVAARLGYTNILLWNGTFGDATAISAAQLLKLADRYLKPGTIMLGHANHPTVTHLFPQLLRILSDRHLEPVTLDTMFGTSRSTG